MNLLEVRDAHPSLFYLDQHWYEAEAFALVDGSALAPEFRLGETPRLYQLNGRGETDIRLIRAVDLALLYVANPLDTRWQCFIWTDDVDSWGNRVYVGGVGQYGIKAFQIHRKLEPAAWWVHWP